jgi:hypothetical protein
MKDEMMICTTQGVRWIIEKFPAVKGAVKLQSTLKQDLSAQRSPIKTE